jgi:beta-lactamase superfamily II metal-dependent hydrolase
MKKILALLILALLFFTGCAIGKSITSAEKAGKNKETLQQVQNTPNISNLQNRPDTLKVHFLDAGQGDSILIQFPNGRNMLVDAGKNNSAAGIIDYLKKNGINKLDYLVGTHPHEDHIGSLDAVIEHFQIGEVLLPRVTTNTRTFRDVLAAIKNKDLKITAAKAGVNILEDDNLSAKILAPNKSTYEDLNNYSAVIKIKYKEVAFLLTGDAEELSEKEILAGKADVRANVLKVGHHGSHSSTSPAFLKAVNPLYAVISAGAGNDYHHPHGETLKKLKQAGVKVLRTDEKGTIVFTTDGKEIALTTEK